jgi:small-conductance mechanosensitive channel
MFFQQDILFARLQMAGVVLAVFGISLLVRRWLLKRLERQSNTIAGAIRADLGTPSFLWCVVMTVDVLLGIAEFPARIERLGHVLVVSFLILSLTMVASSIVMRLLQIYGEKHSVPFAVAGLSRTLTRALVFGIGLSILLAFLGISITPIWTALGVGGLAVALALQDTLANLFAGVHILIEQPIALGQFVRLSAEEEGTVIDIGWRTTRLLTGNNSTVVIPNKTITSVNLLNYSLPAPEVGIWIPVVVGLEADIAKVERIALDAAKTTEGVLPEPPPILLADPGMTPTHLQYRLAFRVPAQTQGGGIRTQVVNKILAGFRKEGIPLPEIRPR